jgi:hypothetical protein
MSDTSVPGSAGADAGGGAGPAEPDLVKIWPTILELQRFLAERTRGVLRPDGGGDLAVVSVTSCSHHSCD